MVGGLIAYAANNLLGEKPAVGSGAGSVPAPSSDAEMSTTSSAHSGAVYETSTAVSEYLQFHYGTAADVMPYTEAEGAPMSALNFAQR